MNKKEKEENRKKTVKVEPDKGLVSIQDPNHPGDDPKSFTFDACYDWDCKQRDVYDQTAHPLIEEVLNGFNGTIFAYGQTGCGKSFTMMGLPEPPEMRGPPRRTPRSHTGVHVGTQRHTETHCVAARARPSHPG